MTGPQKRTKNTLPQEVYGKTRDMIDLGKLWRPNRQKSPQIGGDCTRESPVRRSNETFRV